MNLYKDIIDINKLEKGQIIAKCELSDCILIAENYIEKYNNENKSTGYTIEMDCIEYYAFELTNIERINPIEAKGKLSF